VSSQVKALPARGTRTLGPTDAHCRNCSWDAKSAGGKVGRDRVIEQAQIHMLAESHIVHVNQMTCIVYEP
jgi:hypothetical protein